MCLAGARQPKRDNLALHTRVSGARMHSSFGYSGFNVSLLDRRLTDRKYSRRLYYPANFPSAEEDPEYLYREELLGGREIAEERHFLAYRILEAASVTGSFFQFSVDTVSRGLGRKPSEAACDAKPSNEDRIPSLRF